MNEELQSANEELETSKEELQAINEELSTVNNQLQEKVEQLEAASNDIANLLTSADIATLFLGTDQRIRRFTPAVTRLFNLIATDNGRPLDDITPRFTDPDLQRDVALVLQTLSPRQAEVRAADGRWYIRRITPYRTSDNRVDGAVVAFSDVSPVKQAEQELRQLSAELEQTVEQRTAELQAKVGELNRIQRELVEERSFVAALLETAGLLVAVLDRQGRIVRCNQACEELAGQGSDKLAGQFFSAALVRPEQRAQCSAWLDHVVAGRHPPDWEQTLARSDGSRRSICWFGKRLPGAYGATDYLIAAGRDVTEQRRIHEEALQQRAEVAHLHRLHTAGALTAALAHEMNQPLAAIAGYADAAIQRLQRGAAAPQELVGDFEQIAQQAHRAARVIAELRRFLAKGDATRAAPCELNEMVRAARKLMLADARLRQVDVELELAEDLPPVLAEAAHIEQVLTNLISNAMDAVRARAASGGEVTVTTRAQSAAMAQVTVSDTGLGIAAGQTERIFEAFHTSKASGLGLGLTISRSIVETCGGRLWAESSRAGGIFHFTLPFAHGVQDLSG